MVRGLYTSALGMITQMNRMDVVTNNIANVDTTGYKRDQVAVQSFTDELMLRLDDPASWFDHDRSTGKVSQGVFVDDIYTDFSPGTLTQTDAALDIAINGQGFFSVNVTNANGQTETLYTRDGAFAMLADGTLVTKDGGIVQGENGSIVLPTGVISIDRYARVYVNDEYIDTLKMVDFTDTHTLRKKQDNYYTTTNESVVAAFGGQIVQGFLEGSNVSSIKEMADMISLSRAYEANSRMITIHDTTLGRAVNDIARR